MYEQEINTLFEELYRAGLPEQEWQVKLATLVQQAGGYAALGQDLQEGINNGFSLDTQFYVIKLFRKIKLPEKWSS